VKTGRPLIIVLILALLPLTATGADTLFIGGVRGVDPFDTTTTLPIHLALSGGGARGLAAIGVLEAFEEKGIVVTGLAGTSIGGIVGGLYACGYSGKELAQFVRQTDFNDLFGNRPTRQSMFVTQRQERDRHLVMLRFDGFRPRIPQGLTSGQKLTSVLNSLTARAVYRAGGDFSKLPIPFRAVTTDIVSGNMVVLTSGSLADAMRATMAFPLAFTGIERGHEILMDGGMVAPVPVDIARAVGDSGAFTVAINLTSPLVSKEHLQSPFDIANQVTSIMSADKLKKQLALADFVITPDIHGLTSQDFDERDSLIACGYRTGLRAADSIISVLTHRAEVDRHKIVAVTCLGADSVLSFALRRLNGQEMTLQVLQRQLQAIVRDFGLFSLTAAISHVADRSSQAITVEVQTVRPLPLAGTQIEFVGVSRYRTDSLKNLMALADSVISLRLLQRGLDRIVNLYHTDGYDLADVTDVSLDVPARTIRVTIDEAIVSRIDVSNNKRARDWLVRSYVPLKRGEPYRTERAEIATSNLYGTDLFDRVGITPQRDHDSAVAAVTVDERPSSQVRLGWHWDDEYQSEQFAELLNDNVMGIGLEYLVHAQFAYRRQVYFGEVKVNRIFKSYVTSQMRFFHERLDRPLFDQGDTSVASRHETKTGALIRVGQQIARLGNFSGSLTVEQVRWRDSRQNVTSKLNLTLLSIESLVETFDRWPYPNSGKKHFLDLQFSGRLLGGQAEYTRFFTSLEAYFPIGKYLNYHPRLSLGLSRNDLPPTEQFFMGGQQSFGGYRTYQRSGDKIFVLNQELRVSLPFHFYVIGRYDAGETYAQLDQVKLRNLHHGFIATLAYDSFIGPVEFSYGFKDRHVDRFYFSAGLVF
jgi:NTE family protein